MRQASQRDIEAAKSFKKALQVTSNSPQQRLTHWRVLFLLRPKQNAVGEPELESAQRPSLEGPS
ncbi:hypothetical protein HispidOSU_021706 [Sigmodon hispidus]